MKRRLGRSATLAIFAIGILVVAALDKLTKSLAVEALADGSVRPFIPGLLDFRLVYNTGAAWGIFEGARMLFLIIAIAALAAILAYLLLAKRCALLEVIGLSLVAGGAIGNAIDRAQMGQVVDFIHTLFIDFPLFNLADSAITLGVILFIFFLLFGGRANARAGRSQERGERSPAAAAAADGPDGGEAERGRGVVRPDGGEAERGRGVVRPDGGEGPGEEQPSDAPH